MIDIFIGIFTTTCVQLVALIPAVLGIWLLFDLIGGLIFSKR